MQPASQHVARLQRPRRRLCLRLTHLTSRLSISFKVDIGADGQNAPKWFIQPRIVALVARARSSRLASLRTCSLQRLIFRRIAFADWLLIAGLKLTKPLPIGSSTTGNETCTPISQMT